MSELWVPDKYRAEVAKADTAPAPFFAASSSQLDNTAAVARARMDVVRQGATSANPFAPGLPLEPYEGVDGQPRAWDFPTGYNIKARADREGRMSFEALKKLTDAYDVARMCIQHRIDDVRSLDWTIVPAEGINDNLTDVIRIAKRYLKKPDGHLPFRLWLAKYLEDVLRYDAGVLAKRYNRAGRCIGLDVVQGSTIAPVADYWGRPPTGDAPAYVQFVNGLPWKWFTADKFIYRPFRPQTDSMYGLAPIEAAFMAANTDSRFQLHWLNWFTAGNIPDGFGILPENVGQTPEDRDRWQKAWDALEAGNDDAKSQIRWMPNGTSFEWPKEHVFDEAFPVFLMKKVCAAFGVTPQDIGFTDDVNRATGETQADVQFRVGTRPLLKHIEEILTDYLQDDLGLPVEFQFDEGKESEDRLESAKVWEIGIKYGAVSPDEMRQEFFGLEIDEERPTPRYIDSAREGAIPLRSLDAVAGDVDPETKAPTEAHPLDPAPFDGTPGISPNKNPGQPTYQRAPIDPDDPRYPQGGHEVPGSGTIVPPPPAGTASAQAAPGKPVEKDGGITAASGLVGYDEVKPTSHVQKSDTAYEDFAETARAEIERVRRIMHPEETAASVQKAEGTTVAGLAVVAGDTGRVLMIQRAITEGDPAAGRWEFPGGHLEDGEGPLVAAAREWAEETGMVLPGTVRHVDTWDNGPYRLHVAVVPREDDLALNPDAPAVVNPDDPDGDMTETVAWWEVPDLPGMPALRDEARDTPWDMLTGATPGNLDGVRKALAAWRRNARGAVERGHLPRKFTGLPASVEAGVWKGLRGARDRDAVDAAFARVLRKAGEPADPKGWRADPPKPEPQHRLDLRLTDYYQPEVQAALENLWDHAQMEEWTASIVGSGTREAVIRDQLIAMSFGRGLDDTDLNAALTRLWADAYYGGALAATQQLGIEYPAGWDPKTMDKAPGWDAWKPGIDLALVTRAGGWASAIAEAGVTIAGMNAESLRLVGSAIERGVAAGSSISEIARGIRSTVGSADRAEMIAHTESARMLTRASAYQYQAAGVQQWDWVTSAGACTTRCLPGAAAGPYSVAESGLVPAHPRCRCAISPHMPDRN